MGSAVASSALTGSWRTLTAPLRASTGWIKSRLRSSEGAGISPSKKEPPNEKTEPSLSICNGLVLCKQKQFRGLTNVDVEISVVDVEAVGGLLEVL